MTYFTARSNLVPDAFVWEKGKTMNFSATIGVYDLKLATDDWSDKKFLLTSKLCPLRAVCPLPWGYIHVFNHEKNCIKSEWFQRHFLWNLQQMNEVTRHLCWHKKFVPWGLSAPPKWPKWQDVPVDIKILSHKELSAPAPGLHICIKS